MRPVTHKHNDNRFLVKRVANICQSEHILLENLVLPCLLLFLCLCCFFVYTDFNWQHVYFLHMFIFIPESKLHPFRIYFKVMSRYHDSNYLWIYQYKVRIDRNVRAIHILFSKKKTKCITFSK